MVRALTVTLFALILVTHVEHSDASGFSVQKMKESAAKAAKKGKAWAGEKANDAKGAASTMLANNMEKASGLLKEMEKVSDAMGKCASDPEACSKEMVKKFSDDAIKAAFGSCAKLADELRSMFVDEFKARIEALATLKRCKKTQSDSCNDAITEYVSGQVFESMWKAIDLYMIKHTVKKSFRDKIKEYAMPHFVEIFKPSIGKPVAKSLLLALEQNDDAKRAFQTIAQHLETSIKVLNEKVKCPIVEAMEKSFNTLCTSLKLSAMEPLADCQNIQASVKKQTTIKTQCNCSASTKTGVLDIKVAEIKDALHTTAEFHKCDKAVGSEQLCVQAGCEMMFDEENAKFCTPNTTTLMDKTIEDSIGKLLAQEHINKTSFQLVGDMACRAQDGAVLSTTSEKDFNKWQAANEDFNKWPEGGFKPYPGFGKDDWGFAAMFPASGLLNYTVATKDAIIAVSGQCPTGCTKVGDLETTSGSEARFPKLFLLAAMGPCIYFFMA